MAPTAQEESSSTERPVVVLTGYGLFRNYPSNSSKEVSPLKGKFIESVWVRSQIVRENAASSGDKRYLLSQVVENIAATGIDGIDLRTEILPVAYDAVRERTQELHEKYKPCVTIHCGMYSEAHAVILEQVARNTGQ